MENKNDIKKEFATTSDWFVYNSFKNHCARYNELKKKSNEKGLSDEEGEKIKYHKSRMDYIKKFAENPKVPVVYVPDECFSDEWQKPKKSYKIDNDQKANEYYCHTNNYAELLYPHWSCKNEKNGNNKNVLTPVNDKKDNKINDQCGKKIDIANPYLPMKDFLIKQKREVNDCWLLSLIIGIVNHDATYIPEKMVRDYPNENERNLNNNVNNVNNNEYAHDINKKIESRPKRATVRLFDEDGLPVDIVVDKTRPDDDSRPLWIIMLEKAACVMLSRNIDKKFCNRQRNVDYGNGVVCGIDWSNIGQKEKSGIQKITYGNDVQEKFCTKNIDMGSAGVGVQVIFGKNHKKYDLDENENFKLKDIIQHHLKYGKLLVGGTTGNTDSLTNNHYVYIESLSNSEFTTIDSMLGKQTIDDADLYCDLSECCVTDFPDIHKSIEKEIDLGRINQIENDILGENKKNAKENDKNIKINHNSEKSHTVGNKNQYKNEINSGAIKQNQKYETLSEVNNKSQKKIINTVNNKIINDNKKFTTVKACNQNKTNHMVSLNLNDNNINNSKNQIVNINDKMESNLNNLESSKNQNVNKYAGIDLQKKPSNKIKYLIASIILALITLITTLILKYMLIYTISAYVIVFPPTTFIMIGIVLIMLHIKFSKLTPKKINTKRDNKNYCDDYIQNAREKSRKTGEIDKKKAPQKRVME